MARIQKRTRITRPIGSSSNSEVVEARSSATYGDFASLDARIENFELIVVGAAHAAVTLAADIAPILSISAGQELSLDSQLQNLAFLSPNGSTGDPTFRAIVAADLPSTIVYDTRQVIAGAGLTGGGALSSDVTLNVATADTSMTINADSIQVRLATTSGLQISTGLMIADTVAGDGLTIASKILAVGAGDGIDVAADSIAVDVTDIIGNGLVEAATNNIALGTPGTVTSTSTNAVTASSHTHAVDSTIAKTTDLHAQSHVLATTSALGPDHTVSGLTARQVLIATGATTALFRALQVADLPTGATLSVSSTNSSDSHAITTSSNPGAAAAILASTAAGYLQLVRIGLGVSPSYPLHTVSTANSEAFYVVANSLTTGVAFTVEAPLSTTVDSGKGFQVKVNGEAFGRVMFYTDGKFGVGGGAATRDTFLSRSAANTWLVSSDGSTGVAHIAMNATGTVDGVDISAHAADNDAHHNQAHVLATTSALGPDHTVSGLTARQVLIATGATTALFRAIQAADLPTGATLSVSSTNSGDSHAITTSASVSSATATILATDANGRVRVQGIGLGAAAAATSWVTVGSTGGIGLSNSGAGRLAFVNTTVDQAIFSDVLVGFNGTTPQAFIHIDTISSDPPCMVLNAGTNGEIATETGAQIRIGHWSGAAFTERLRMGVGGEWQIVDSSVAHGMTTFADTETYGSLEIVESGSGGLNIVGYKDADGANNRAISLTGRLGEAADTTKSTAGRGVVEINAQVKSGTGVAAVGANGNLLSVNTAGTTRWIVDAEGDTHRDGSDNTFDAYDDAQLARAFDIAVSPGSIIDSEFDNMILYNKEDLIRAGILHESGFYNESRLLRLAIGAVWQGYAERKELLARVRELEQRLLRA